MLDSTVLTIGTALRRAQDAELPVEVLIHGSWLSGFVLGLDGHGAFLDGDGESAVIRLQDVCAVRVHQAPRRRADRAEPAPEREGSARVGAHAAPVGVAAIG